jgi:putative hydrolase of the HAD superfamily
LPIEAIFWDVGGVLLTNAWDHTERAQALQHFQVDEKDFHSRHDTLAAPFERGEITLDEYLERTVFYCARPFSREVFKQYMFSLSKPMPAVLDFARALATSGKFFMGTINNESRELNNYRIEHYGLRKIFRVFISSCFVGLRKPDREIYRLALETTQMTAENCCFIDDRAANLESPAQLGIHTIQMQTMEGLKRDLEKIGVAL